MSAKPKAKVEVTGAETKAKHRAALAPDLPDLCRSIFEGSRLPMAMVTGARHIVRYVNPAFSQIVGKSADELTGSPFAEVMRDGCVLFLDRVYRTGEAESHSEPGHSEEHPLYWSYEMWPVLGADEHPVGVIFQVTETAGFHQQAAAMNQELMLRAVRQNELAEVAEKLNARLQREITERKQMEEALIRSEKLAVTARLAATMAHEINNPLEAMTNLVFLLSPLQTSPEAQRYIAALEEQLKGLSRISTQMLKFYRDINRPTDFKLSEVLHDVLNFYRPRAEGQGVAVREHIETEGTITGFRGEIAQVITNLLLNALAATSIGGKVMIHLYPAPPWLCEVHRHRGFCLSIADTGSGIDPQHRARIFEPFFTTKGEKGTGLGLWLCAGIIDRIGGSIRVWSARRPGRSGTCFSIFLPTGDATSTPARRRYEQ
ncbi:MAG: PAS domain-containing sensor histidine kinase [Acidobacteriia bacterium]|nr:PAS domain-containing sensor histidine kinase [Terriglobia bacterium]